MTQDDVRSAVEGQVDINSPELDNIDFELQDEEKPAEPEQASQEGQEQAVETPTTQPEEDPASLEQVLQETGFKDGKALTKSHKELRKTLTQKSMREKELEREMEDLREAIKTIQADQRAPHQGQGPTNEDFFEKPLESVDQRVTLKVQQELGRQKAIEDFQSAREKVGDIKWDSIVNGGYFDMAAKENPHLMRQGVQGLVKTYNAGRLIAKKYAEGIQATFEDISETPESGETQEQTRLRIIKEQEAAKKATVKSGGTTRSTADGQQQKINKLTKEGRAFELVDILLEGME